MLINPNTWTKIADGTCKVSSNSPFEYIVFADINKSIFKSGYCNPSLDVIHDGDIYAKTHEKEIQLFTNPMGENTQTKIDTAIAELISGADEDSDTLKELSNKIKQLKEADSGLVSSNKLQNLSNEQKQQARDNINAVSALDVTQLIQTNTVSLIEQVNRQSDPLNYFNPTIRFSIHQSTGTIIHNSQKGITFTPDADSYTIFRLENVIDEITTYQIVGQVKSSVASTLYVDINDLGDTPDPTRPDRQFYTAISTTTDYQPFSVIIKNTKVNNTYNFVDFTTQSIATFDIKELRIIKDYQQAINDAITTEQQARINADTTLDNRITALDTAYQQADTHLHEQIQALRQSDNITERLNNLHINTRNFLQKANFGNWTNGNWVDYKFVITNQTRAGAKFIRSFGLAGTQVIFSFFIKKTAGRIVSLGGHTQSLSNQQIYLDGNLVGDDFNNGFSYPNDEATHRVVIKATDAYDTVVGDKNLYIQPNRGTTSGGFYNQQYSCEIWDCMLQVGTLTTDWTPAPEDVQGAIDSKASSASLDEFKSAQATKDQATATKISQIETAYKSADNNLTAKIASETTARTSSDNALSGRIDSLQSEFNGNKSAVANQLKTLTDKDSATATKISQITANVTTAQNTANTANGKADTATTKADNAQRTANTANSAIATEQRARADGDSSLASRITALDSAYKSADSALSGRITTAQQTATNAEQALATAQSQLNARFDSLSVGGRNLIPNTHKHGNSNNGVFDGFNVIKLIKPAERYIDYQYRLTRAMNEPNCVFSFWAKADAENVVLTAHLYSPNTVTKAVTSQDRTFARADGLADIVLSTEWRHYYVVYTQTPSDTPKAIVLRYQATRLGTEILIAKPKLETGNVATDWTPAPEDIQNLINDLTARIRALETR